ncbi:MAG: DNA polymerase IV, partial [Planctomycetota bacterium]
MDRFDSDPRLSVIHADMDAFFAAVEILDDPSLAGQPLIIGHPGPRGVVSTASYEARKFGVNSGMPSTEALRRCPKGIWRSPRGSRYQQISRQVMGVFREFTPEIEPLSVDEAFLDIAGSLRLFGGAVSIATGIQARIPEQTGGLTVSVGVASNKFLAKLASDLKKPNGLTVVDPDQIQQLLDPLAVEKIWGVGPRTRDILHAIGLRKVHHIREAGLDLLIQQ